MVLVMVTGRVGGAATGLFQSEEPKNPFTNHYSCRKILKLEIDGFIHLLVGFLIWSCSCIYCTPYITT